MYSKPKIKRNQDKNDNLDFSNNPGLFFLTKSTQSISSVNNFTQGPIIYNMNSIAKIGVKPTVSPKLAMPEVIDTVIEADSFSSMECDLVEAEEVTIQINQIPKLKDIKLSTSLSNNNLHSNFAKKCEKKIKR